MGTSPRLDFLEFIRSVVGGLLKSTSSASSGPNGRRITPVLVCTTLLKQKLKDSAQTAKNTVEKCQECGVRLHPMCFLDYHK